MRLVRLFVLYAGFAVSTCTAGVVEYSVTPLSPHYYRYDYLLNGLSLLANQELDIRFDPTLFGSLSNAIAGSGFYLVPCCQPNNPLGAFGDYAIVALTGLSSPSGPFSVEVFVPTSAYPGPQPFFVNQLDAGGNLLFNVTAGYTVVDPPVGTPEPANARIVAAGLLVGLAWCWARRRLRCIVR